MTEGRFYPPTEERAKMRAQIIDVLEDRPAKLVAGECVKEVVHRGSEHNPSELGRELGRMMGTAVRINPDNTLVHTPYP